VFVHADPEKQQAIDETRPLVLDRNNPQGQGSAITYARRCALMHLLSLEEPEIRRRIQAPRDAVA
jgi:hypothetical protein